MTIVPGTQLGAYRIVAPLGAGGMGEVYRARDTRLDREVAIKVLPADFAQDGDRLRRFEQEARTTSALNHSNILTIYDIGHTTAEQGNAPYIVAELLDGKELRAQLGNGPVPVKRTIDYAPQIAAGLAAAHEKGIVQRDLKPENLFVPKDGRVKILDVGLAKLKPPKLSGGVDSEAPTMNPLTNPGVVLGTVGYMSPEQVRGQETDHRSDIFSFGMILYEMLSGKRAFSGAWLADVMSAILKEDPPELSETNAKVSPALDKIVRRRLEKKPERRFQSASDLGFALEALSTPSGARLETAPTIAGVTESAPVSKARWFGKARLAWVWATVTSLALLAVLPFAVKYLRQAPPPEAAAIRFTIALPEKVTNPGRAMHISPDGRNLFFNATLEGKRQLWLRPINGFTAQPIPGTEGVATIAFWSPDSRSIGFFADGKLKRVDLPSGTVQTICALPTGAFGGAWGRDGTIIFYATGAIYRVPAAGGEPKLALTYGGGRPTNIIIRPYFLPDSRHFLHYGGATQEAGIYVASLDGKESKRLLAADSELAER